MMRRNDAKITASLPHGLQHLKGSPARPQANNNVILQQDQSGSLTTSETPAGHLLRAQQNRWAQSGAAGSAQTDASNLAANLAASQQQQLPPWMLETVAQAGAMGQQPQTRPYAHAIPQGHAHAQQHAQRTNGDGSALATPPSAAAQCPEVVARGVRWPHTRAGLSVQMACPESVAQSGSAADLFAASLACLPGGRWAPHVQAARCQSHWLRNLTRRHEAGDSPLSILSELVQRTREPARPQSAHWPPWTTGGLLVGAGGQPAELSGTSWTLFGDDLVQISRLLRRLVNEELAELLARIADDKQRVSFAREAIQVSTLFEPEEKA